MLHQQLSSAQKISAFPDDQVNSHPGACSKVAENSEMHKGKQEELEEEEEEFVNCCRTKVKVYTWSPYASSCPSHSCAHLDSFFREGDA